MKKITMLLGVIFAIFSAKAAAVEGRNYPAINVTFNSATIITQLDSIYPGVSQSKVIVKKLGDSIFISGPTIPVTGRGQLSSSVYGLSPSTEYISARTLQDSTHRDTIWSTVTFTTLPAPVYPNITFLIQPNLDSTKFTVSISNANGITPKFYIAYGPTYSSFTDTAYGTGTFSHTFSLYTPNPLTSYNYCVNFLRDTVLQVRDSCKSFTTPAAIKGDITNVVTTTGIDSVKFSISMNIGTYPGNLKIILKDSVGTIISTSAPITVSSSGTYNYVIRGLAGNTPYFYVATLSNATGTDTAANSIRTKRPVDGIISSMTLAAGIDSIKITTSITRGTYPGTLKFILKDSTGTVLQTSAPISIGTSASVMYIFRGLTELTLYKIEADLSDSVSVDTAYGSIRTLMRPRKPAPIARFRITPYPVTYRGYIKLGGYDIYQYPGDIGRAAIVRGTNDSTLANMRDTVLIIGMVSGNIFQDTISMDAPHTSTRYHWRIITWSSDGIMAVSPAISAPTENYSPPKFLLDQIGLATSPNPTLQISGDGFGEAVVIYVNIYDNVTGLIVWSDTINVGFGTLNGYSVPLPNLPPGDYVVRGNLRTGRGDVLFKEIPVIKRISIATAVKQNTFENVSIFPNPTNGLITIKGLKEKVRITVFNTAAQLVFETSDAENINITGNPTGIYFMYIRTENNEIFTQKINLE